MDCLVIGAGPGGLTAAIYLARYLRDVAVVDDERSRALWIPRSHNCPGYPEGIPGPDLVGRMKQQAARYGASILRGQIDALERLEDGSFAARLGERTIAARTVILATGVEDVTPPVADLWDAVQRGLVRYCPACDAYEVRDRRIGVIGAGKCRVEEATLLRCYTADLTVLSLHCDLELAEAEREELEATDVQLVSEPVAEIAIEAKTVALRLAQSGRILRFDAVYAALGLRGRSGLATRLGAEHDEDGMLLVDDRQRTSVPGLYAAGDVVQGMTQISVAMGQATIAANTINMSLERRLRAPVRQAR